MIEKFCNVILSSLVMHYSHAHVIYKSVDIKYNTRIIKYRYNEKYL